MTWDTLPDYHEAGYNLGIFTEGQIWWYPVPGLPISCVFNDFVHRGEPPILEGDAGKSFLERRNG